MIEKLKEKCGGVERLKSNELGKLQKQLHFLRQSGTDVKEMSLPYGAEKASIQNEMHFLKGNKDNDQTERNELYVLLGSRKDELDQNTQTVRDFLC